MLKRAIRSFTPRVWLGFSFSIILVVVSCEFLAFPSSSKQASKTANSVVVLGEFLRVKHSGEDAFGYALQLWKEGDQIFGLLAIFTGAPADPPTGILEDIKFDPRTRRFSFSARLSTGRIYAGGNWNTSTRDRYSFSGVLTRREVAGVLKHSDELRPTDPPTSERIRLRRSADATHSMSQPASYSEWKTWADKILRFRGPRW